MNFERIFPSLGGGIVRKVLILLLLFSGTDLFAKKMIRVGEDTYCLANEELDGRRSTTREFVRPSESIPVT
jgi:hypothetical protein